MTKFFQHAATLVSSGFGSGYARRAPGTWGSAAALVLWLLLSYLEALPSTFAQVALAGSTTLVGTLAVISSISADSTDSDPQWIVVDEWAGLFVSLLGLALAEWWWIFGAFVLFRVLDASKVGPVGAAERLPGALGIMADDVVAGSLTALAIYVLRTAGGL